LPDDRGIIPVVLLLTTRDVWKDGHMEVGATLREDSFKVAREGHADSVDAIALIAEQYEKLGPEETFGMFHGKEPVRIDLPGAFMDARCVVAGLKGLSDATL